MNPSHPMPRYLTLTTGLLLGVVAFTSVQAEPIHKTKPVTPTTPTLLEPLPAAKLTVTGYNTRQSVKRTGGHLATSSPVYVIDGEQLSRSGATTVAQALKTLPSVH